MEKSSFPFVIGHRGACAFLPENTLASFHLAFEQRAHGIEFDVHTTKDKVPVIIHDATLNRTTNGKGYVSRHTFKDLQKLDAGFFFDPEKNQSYPERGKKMGVISFETLLETFKARELFVEIKEQSAELTHQVVSLIKKYGMEEHCVVGSKYHTVSSVMKEHYPSMRRFLSKREFVSLFLDSKVGALHSEKDPFAVASMPIEACGLAFGNAEFIDYLHRLKIKAYYWTVNNPIVMKELAKRGADGIITDNPKLAAETFAR